MWDCLVTSNVIGPDRTYCRLAALAEGMMGFAEKVGPGVRLDYTGELCS